MRGQRTEPVWLRWINVIASAQDCKTGCQMTKGIRILLFILPTVVLCCFVGFRIIVKGHPDTRSPQDIRFQAATNQMAAWSLNADFEEIGKTENFKSDFQKLLEIKTDFQITSNQIVLLQDSIYDFLMAYHTGDYAVYTNFRMMAAGNINPQHLNILRNFIAKNGSQSLASLSTLPQDELFRNFVGIRSEGTFYKDYFLSVSLKTSKVEVKAYKRIPKDLKTFVFDDTTNLGVASFEPMYTYDRNPETILHQDGSIIYATAVLYIKTKEPSGSDMPAPVYLRLTWDSESKKWLPSELAVGNIWQKTKIVIAF